MRPVFIPSIQEGLEEAYLYKNEADLALSVIIAREKIERALEDMEIKELPDVLDLSIEDQAMVYLETCNLLAKRYNQSFYLVKDELASAIIQEGKSVLWDYGESWGMDCYYFWSEEVGQISIHDPNGLIRWGKSTPTCAQEWSQVPRQDLALLILTDREIRQKMARATNIFLTWDERREYILEFYDEEDLE